MPTTSDDSTEWSVNWNVDPQQVATAAGTASLFVLAGAFHLVTGCATC
jgi:hypothetical protein